MIDLHTHILQKMDDGAKNLEESIKLLRMEIDSGVHTVALTPHYLPNTANFKDFLKRRKAAYKLLCAEVKKQKLPISLILGAEVAYSPELLELDIDELCFEDTKTILIELPANNYPALIKNVFFELQLKGYTPLLAHTERYGYFVKNLHLLEELVNMGVNVQINASSLTQKLRSKKRLLNMISDGLVHAVASDTHGVELRPPQLAAAIKIIEKKLGAETAQRMVSYKL